MTYAPPTLQTLARYWVAEGGVNLGVVGDTAHATKGTSYHLGKDQLSATAYSIKTARDKVGLTNGASAIDLGRLDGTFMNLRKFSSWLVTTARTNAPGTSDMREIIYSPDGKAVLRWDRERGYASAPETGEADTSHLTHTHISWYRDSEKRDHTTAFRPYFTHLPDTSTGGDDMFSLPEAEGPYPCTLDTGTKVYGSSIDTTEDTTVNLPAKPFYVIGAGSSTDTATTGRRAIYGRRSGVPVRLGWVDVASINR